MNHDELARLVFARLGETAGVADADDHFAIDKWEWPQGVALYGLYRRYLQTQNPADLAFLKAWFHRGLAAGLPVRNVNTTAPLLALTCLLDHEPRPEWSALCRSWAEWVMNDMPRTEEGGLQHITSHLVNPGELWADTLFMTVLFLAKAGRTFDRPDWVEEASYQFLLHIRYLSDPAAGLWYHGWTFEGRHHYGKIHWARGNAWFTLAGVEFLDLIRPQGAVARTIEQALQTQLRTLARCQDAGGLWHTILDNPTTYTETSASAAIAYAALKAGRMGLLPLELKTMATRAFAAVTAQVDDRGVVQGVSHGTALGMDADHYKRIAVKPTAYGQGLVCLMLTEGTRG